MNLHDVYKLYRERKVTHTMFLTMLESLIEQRAVDPNLLKNSAICKPCFCIDCTNERLHENQRQIRTIKFFMSMVKNRGWNVDTAMTKLLTEFKQAEQHLEYRHSHWQGVTHDFVKRQEVDE